MKLKLTLALTMALTTMVGAGVMTVQARAGRAGTVLAPRVEKRKLLFDGRERTFLVNSAAGSQAAPLIVLLHGSGRNADSIFSPWQSLAKKEGIVLAAPDAVNPAGWNLQADGPDFLKALVDEVAKGTPVDPRRMYLFGHSAGGHHALDMALLESEFFAAAAVHAGVVTDPGTIVPRADRKIPLAIWSGIDDRIVPIAMVRSTLATLTRAGFPIIVTEMPGHTHDYYGSANQVNAAAWAMLKTHALSADPKFKSYQFR